MSANAPRPDARGDVSSDLEASARPFFCALYTECDLRPAMHWGFDSLEDYYHHIEVAHLIARVNAPAPLVRKAVLQLPSSMEMRDAITGTPYEEVE